MNTLLAPAEDENQEQKQLNEMRERLHKANGEEYNSIQNFQGGIENIFSEGIEDMNKIREGSIDSLIEEMRKDKKEVVDSLIEKYSGDYASLNKDSHEDTDSLGIRNKRKLASYRDYSIIDKSDISENFQGDIYNYQEKLEELSNPSASQKIYTYFKAAFTLTPYIDVLKKDSVKKMDNALENGKKQWSKLNEKYGTLRKNQEKLEKKAENLVKAYQKAKNSDKPGFNSLVLELKRELYMTGMKINHHENNASLYESVLTSMNNQITAIEKNISYLKQNNALKDMMASYETFNLL